MAKLIRTPGPDKWLKTVINNPWKIIVATSIITVFFLLQLPSLRIQTSIYDLTIENLPAKEKYDAFKEEFGSEEVVLVVAKAENIFSSETFERISELSRKFTEIKGVKRVVSLPGIKKAMDVTEKWDMADFEKFIAPVSLFKRNLLSEDKKTTVISLVLEDVEEKSRIIEDVEAVIQKEGKSIPLYQIGMPVVSNALAEFTARDFHILPPITFLLIAVLLFFFFRSIRGILIPAGSVLIVLAWTFGIMAVTGTPLSMLTMIVPIFIIAVGTAYCMYIFPEYIEAIFESEDSKEASFRCFKELLLPTSLAVITTTIGLGSLLANRISAIREFAVFSCVGILCMLIIIFTYLPALTTLLPRPKNKLNPKASENNFITRFLALIIRLNIHHQKIVLPLVAIIMIIGLFGISKIRVETNPVDFFKKDTDISRNFHDIYRDMAGSFPINVVLDSKKEDFFENPDNYEQVTELQRFLGSLQGVDKTISFLDYMKLVKYATNQYQESFYALPDESFEVRMLVNDFKSMLGDDMLSRFMSQDFSKTNIMLRTHLSSSDDFLSIKSKISEHIKNTFPRHFSFQVTGFGIVISESSELLTEGQVKSLSITLILVFAIMFLLFMSYKVGLIGLLPNCFPIIVTFGMMGWLGIPLSVATSLIASIAIGLAVDDTIHYLVRYNREFKKDLDKKRALKDTIFRIGRPIVMTTMTVSLGFSILMVSSFKPTAVFGILMVITMFSALIADLVLLPSLMLHVELVTVWDLLKLKMGKDPQKGIPLFEGLSRSQVHYILMSGTLKKHDSGDVIMRKGEMSDSMYAIISGDLEVVDFQEDPPSKIGNGSRQLIAKLRSGDVVGEMGLIRSCERSATVIATQPVELLQINRMMIKRLQWLYPPTAQKFFFNLMTILSDRLENLTNDFLGVCRTESLTGVHSRDFFHIVLGKEIVRCQRYENPLSLLMMELDHLEEMESLYGPGTDEILAAQTAEFLGRTLRRSDVLCRYNRTRFAALLPQIGAEKARMACDRFRKQLEQNRFHVNETPVYMDINFGLATLEPKQEKSMDDLLNEAVKSLTEESDSKKRI